MNHINHHINKPSHSSTSTGHHHKKKSKKQKIYKIIRNAVLIIIGLFLIGAAVLAFYISTITIPDFSNFANRRIDNSTQLYDRTGEILLYDVHSNVKRTQISGDKISPYIKKATIAIEDKYFYSHHGIRPTSILRALIANIKAGSFVQGGSTIDQQLIKNALLTQDKSIIRKVTEWAMAIKLDTQVSKDDILTMYLNESSYGGNIYGVETAAQYFFGMHASDISLAQSAYLAALPNAPSYYSPYGNHVSELDARKNLILRELYNQNLISGDEYQKALNEKVVWQKNATEGKALHFVFFVRGYLENKYGKDVVDKGGLKVVTTIDYDLQSQAESIVKKYALENAKKYHATNAGLVTIDVKTGQILTMVGSRDYFDNEIPGNFNVTTALRQPGSSFKPIVYATAFMDGYTPSTVIFDVPTEFSTTCDPEGNPLPGYTNSKCYSPENYDGKFRGPVTIKNALAQSLNIPAVKTLYLAGVKNSIETAQKMGITSLDPKGDYGLSLVLGSGEVSLLQMTNAYAVFGNQGNYNPTSFILSVTDKDGNVLEKFNQNTSSVLPSYIADEINDILSDNKARTPLYGPNSGLYFGDRPVADKTGTTNSYRDTWTIGYTPSIAVGVWAGNNDNTPINKQLSGMIAVPMWNEFMNYALKDKPIEQFVSPDPTLVNSNIKNLPPVKGIYCYNDGGINYSYSILPENDSQYILWKIPADNWVQNNGCPFVNTNQTTAPIIIN
ncbi:MAG: transglycosylase domain-containing protein [Candidatus Paceibacterota bacterium]|jgi:1A family penicillin-binding protein